MVYIVKPFSNSMSLVATAILVTGYTRGWRQCSITAVSMIQKRYASNQQPFSRSGHLQRDSRCYSHSDEKPRRDTDVFCRVPWSGHPLYQNLDYYTQRTAEAFQEDMLLCNPVIQHSHVRMSTMPQSYDIVQYDLFSHSYI